MEDLSVSVPAVVVPSTVSAMSVSPTVFDSMFMGFSGAYTGATFAERLAASVTSSVDHTVVAYVQVWNTIMWTSIV